jgi:hypothetical protein
MSRENTQNGTQTALTTRPPLDTNPPYPREAGKSGAKVARLALTKAEAAESLGLSVDSFDRYVAPELRIVRRGRCRLIAVAELERWLDRSSSSLLEDLS